MGIFDIKPINYIHTGDIITVKGKIGRYIVLERDGEFIKVQPFGINRPPFIIPLSKASWEDKPF